MVIIAQTVTHSAWWPGLQSSAGLVSARGMLPEQAQRATHEIGRQWVLDRISFIAGSDFSPDN
ncbi:hypothetical protein [Mangrovibacter phragmitis]|uniref:hypothetical protein n=1 Tax=Mangrovibacter phragmitis TaxID=1691903 RepID=UPI00336A4B6E